MQDNAINIRYSALAESSCCLSCGGAINYTKPKNGDVCVDLGSGRGTDAIRLANAVAPAGKVYGIDISQGMLDKARKSAKKLEINNLEFIQAELEQLPIESNVANWVISNCTINHAGDKAKVWGEIYRILGNGGVFIVSDIYAVEPIAEEYRNNPQAVAECWAGAITRNEYLQILENTGFSNIEIIEESEPYSKGKAIVASFTIRGLKPSLLQ